MEQKVLPITDKKNVGDLIPQKYPFVMLDSLLSYSDEFITSGYTVVQDNLFVSNSIFQESGLIEHMAQTVALHTGYSFFLRNEEAPVGYIGAIKKVVVSELPKIGDAIETEVQILHEFMGVTLVTIVSKLKGEVIATAEMKTVIAE